MRTPTPMSRQDATAVCPRHVSAQGEPNAPGFPSPLSGHMVFRGGQRQAIDGDEVGNKASHSYMAIRPEPGTLWVFPGSIPHMVMRTILPYGVAEPDASRISVGINFSDAVPPAPIAYALDPWLSLGSLFEDSD